MSTADRWQICFGVATGRDKGEEENIVHDEKKRKVRSVVNTDGNYKYVVSINFNSQNFLYMVELLLPAIACHCPCM